MRKPENNDDRDEAALEAPPALVVALKKAAEQPLFIPPTVDEAVSRAAHRHLERPRKAPARWLRWMPWVAAATVLTMVAVLPRLTERRKATANAEPVLASKAPKPDGRVDILDAFALARQLKAGMTPAAGWDVNGDGVVDERDVAQLAAQAVKLEKGGRS